MLAFYEDVYRAGAARAGWDVSSLLPGRHHGPSPAGPTPLNTSVPVQLVIAACV
ncbi:hypothetical protein [Kitasatospora sp. NPDC085879]|uniref:hypothetical protein n=1 Tax=Kitasatospora sp. NPDC085879 TaxID=3154769 RepID=UPI0034471223